MAAHTQKDAVLSLTLAGTEYAAQVVNGSLTLPGPGSPTVTPVADGSGKVSEPGDPENGSISGEVFKDTTAAGITRALAAARISGAVLAYVWTEGAGTAEEFSVSGDCTVGSAQSDFTPDKFGRHPIDLALTTAALAAPTP